MTGAHVSEISLNGITSARKSEREEVREEGGRRRREEERRRGEEERKKIEEYRMNEDVTHGDGDVLVVAMGVTHRHYPHHPLCYLHVILCYLHMIFFCVFYTIVCEWEGERKDKDEGE